MTDMTVIVCAHNPRLDYLHRALAALDAQTLPKDKWELLVIDNASTEALADIVDLSWHARGRHVHEARIGLTPARLRGIAEACGDLLVFVDADNVLTAGYLEEASAIFSEHPNLGAFGAGSLDPEFEVQPPEEIRPHLKWLALRSVSTARWSNNAGDYESIPWGAGLCVRLPIARQYRQLVERLDMTELLDRRGKDLLSGGDDVFSWVAASVGLGFGVFPQLRVTHLISASRLNRRYLLTLVRGHAFSHGVLRYVLEGIQPRRITWFRCVRVVLHGVRNGQFSMRCQWAASCGEHSAARLVSARHLQAAERAEPAERRQ
jgi:glycosyltransferase involved in cell wall biosynthesis